ncbi:helix-turn-helix domain-containing protein [Patescibacteria group bacterium]|nr:helix-turn-helix domain-containing protein [Patescibacteria group bacterium]MBU1931478.1 helix-turn-helix domain-containing protein [Patescibacteria group bacterium]
MRRKFREWKEVKAEFLSNPEFKREYEKLRPKYEAISAMIKARLESGLTQKELANKLKTKQSNISRVESGKITPSLTFLNRFAQALGKRLEIRFKPAL